MTDTQYLDEIIEKSGLKIGYICKNLGITPKTFIEKRANRSEFTASEIKRLCEILKISTKDREKIFFN